MNILCQSDPTYATTSVPLLEASTRCLRMTLGVIPQKKGRPSQVSLEYPLSTLMFILLFYSPFTVSCSVVSTMASRICMISLPLVPFLNNDIRVCVGICDNACV